MGIGCHEVIRLGWPQDFGDFQELHDVKYVLDVASKRRGTAAKTRSGTDVAYVTPFEKERHGNCLEFSVAETWNSFIEQLIYRLGTECFKWTRNLERCYGARNVGFRIRSIPIFGTIWFGRCHLLSSANARKTCRFGRRRNVG